MKNDLPAFDDLDALEQSLSTFLKPIQPSKQYINKVKHSIVIEPLVEIRDQLDAPRKAAWAIGSVLAGSLLLLTLARALFFVFRREDV